MFIRQEITFQGEEFLHVIFRPTEIKLNVKYFQTSYTNDFYHYEQKLIIDLDLFIRNE